MAAETPLLERLARRADTTGLLAVDLGAFNPLLGRSYTEIAGESRTMHKSQGFGAAERRGSLVNYLPVRAGDPATTDPFEGIDLTWRRIPGGEAVIPLLEEAKAAFRPEDPSAIVPAHRGPRACSRALDAKYGWEMDTVERKVEELDELIRQASGLWIEAIAEQTSGVPGTSVPAKVTVVNRSDIPVAIAIAPPAPRRHERRTAANERALERLVRDRRSRRRRAVASVLAARGSGEGARTASTSRSSAPRWRPIPVAVPLVATIAGQPIPFMARSRTAGPTRCRASAIGRSSSSRP